MKPGDPIIVLLDGRSHPLLAGTTLAEMVAQLGHAPAAVATAINGIFVPRAQRDERLLANADAVLLFKPIVGG
ncbi:MAG: sulfur carrier protein ThiS [Burkholderiales bacterium]